MKLIRTFAITADEFYDYLEQQLCADIQKASGRAVKAKDLKKGFCYHKKEARTKITIDEYERNKIYATTARCNTDYVKVVYQTQEKENGLEIVFEQFVSGYDDVRESKNRVVRFFYDWINFGRMSNTLYDMRQAILNKREGIEPKKLQPPKPLTGLSRVIEKKLDASLQAEDSKE